MSANTAMSNYASSSKKKDEVPSFRHRSTIGQMHRHLLSLQTDTDDSSIIRMWRGSMGLGYETGANGLSARARGLTTSVSR